MINVGKKEAQELKMEENDASISHQEKIEWWVGPIRQKITFCQQFHLSPH